MNNGLSWEKLKNCLKKMKKKGCKKRGVKKLHPIPGVGLKFIHSHTHKPNVVFCCRRIQRADR
jgi:hypothetical protein